MPLREILAETVGADRGVRYGPENVAVQPGGKPVISKFLEVFMNPAESVLYPNPGFPIYESQIRYLGGRPLPYGYVRVETGFEIMRDQVEAQIDDSTCAIIYNNYQNPIGAESTEDEMEWLADLAHRHNLMVLSDEAYFKILFSGRGRSIVSLPGMRERTIILYTFSKTYAMTGWRLGAAIGPENIIEQMTKLNVNIESCTNHFIQYAGIEALTGDQQGAEEILTTLRGRRDVLMEELLKIDGVRVDRPNSTFYLFPDITEVYERSEADSLEEFRLQTLHATGVAFSHAGAFRQPTARRARDVPSLRLLRHPGRRHLGRPLPLESLLELKTLPLTCIAKILSRSVQYICCVVGAETRPVRQD